MSEAKGAEEARKENAKAVQELENIDAEESQFNADLAQFQADVAAGNLSNKEERAIKIKLKAKQKELEKARSSADQRRNSAAIKMSKFWDKLLGD